jgi:hypothetical protein
MTLIMSTHRELGYFRKRKVFKNSNFLDLTPLRKFPHEFDQKGNAIILVPRFTGILTSKLFQPKLKNPYIKIELDEVGTTIWLLTDGECDVREICRKAEEKLGALHQAHQRVTSFLSGLYMQKFITFKEILK